ncbi:MAG: lycopene beta-cyclase CrtY [Polyangiaceae bacterium]
MVVHRLDKPSSYDYVLVGGGLQNALIALALARQQPACRLALLDARARLGSGHTWSFHESDLSAAERGFVEPLVAHRASSHEVRFASYERTLGGAYCTVSGEQLERVLSECFAERAGFDLMLGRRVEQVEAEHVLLDDGQRLSGTAIIDARGPERLQADVAGYQKFLGLELEWERDHGIDKALLMDARVEQLDGFRFMYVLPFGPRRALIEDTYFSDGGELDLPSLRQRIFDYAATRGLGSPRVVREETGVLPLPRSLSLPQATAPLRAGYAGGFFHPTTGYSFPVAARLASFVAGRPAQSLFGDELGQFVAVQARQVRFALLLNRLLFGAMEGSQRHAVFERFYRLPEASIARFYALRTTPLDRTQILCGRPPRGISLRRALLEGLHP